MKVGVFGKYIKLGRQVQNEWHGKARQEEVGKNYDTPPAGNYALEVSKGVMRVDVDNGLYAEIVEAILEERGVKCGVVQTSIDTRNGKHKKHFYFKDNGRVRKGGAKKTSVLQLSEHDYSVGDKLYCPILVDGVKREVLKQYPVGELDEVPHWLLPCCVNSGYEFLGMGEGDGRDNALLAYQYALVKSGLNYLETKDTITIINEYLLSKPLPTGDIDRICREDVFPEDVYVNADGKFDHKSFGDLIINYYSVKMRKGLLYAYDPVVKMYRSGQRFFRWCMIEKYPGIKKTQQNEVLNYIEAVFNRDEVIDADPKFILVNNGILDIRSMWLSEHTPELFIPCKVPVDWNPNAYNATVDKMFDNISCGDKRLRMLLEEIIGLCLIRTSKYAEAFILHGSGSNGKSTYMDCIRALLGEENYSSLSPQEMTQRFLNAQLNNKLANLGDDIPSTFLEDTSKLKSLISGGNIQVEYKGQDAFTMNSFATMVFGCNEIPRTNDDSDGMLRRMVYVPFNWKVNKNSPDFNPFTIEDITTPEALEYLLVLGINGLLRVLNNGGKVTEVDSVSKLRDTVRMEQNPVLEFLFDTYETIEADELRVLIDGRCCTDVYKSYVAWSEENGRRNMLSSAGFGKKIKSHTGLINKKMRVKDAFDLTIVGKSMNCYSSGE